MKNKHLFSICFKKESLLIIALLFSVVSIFGQERNPLLVEAQKKVTANTGVIVCSVSDEYNSPLEYTTVVVLRLNDSSLVSGGLTDQQGRVLIDNIPWGTYLIRISYVGAKSVFVPNISIDVEKPVAVTGKIQIETSSRQLQGVVVSGQREMIENNLDKRVFNVDRSLVTEGSTGTDVLENIPSVTVDIDGNVSLRGSQSVTILINGRPTDLSMDDIPASTIESIEVVTNPSARYEPDGTSGIINVILKKERKLGFNASLSLGAGMANKKKDVYFGRYSANLNLNFRYSKFNFFLSYNFRSFLSNSEAEMERENIFNNTTTLLNQNSFGSWQGIPQGVRGGFDYFINDRNTISVEGGYRHHTGQWESTMESLTRNSLEDTLSWYEQKSHTLPIPTHSWDVAVTYAMTTKTKGQELTVDISTSERNMVNESVMEQSYQIPTIHEYHQKSNNTTKRNRVNAKLDFVTPIGNGGRLETGYKFDWGKTQDDYSFFSGSALDNLTEDSSRKDASTYKDIVNAVYMVYANSIKTKFKYQLGVRAELATISSLLNSERETFSPRPYFDIFPTLHLRYDFNDIHSMQLGYSIRIRRPRGRELNPFIDDTDRLNLSQGNRKLKPEYTHSVDLGYLMTMKKTSISANIFYRYRYDIISRYTILLNDSTTFTTYENLDNSHSYGLEFSLQQDLFKFWKLTFNASLFQTIINADSNMYDKSLANDLSGQLRLNNNFNLPKDFQIQLSANYRSPTLTLNSMGFESGGAGQGRMSAVWGIDIGIKKSFLKKSLSISLRASDIFYTRNVHIESYGSTSYSAYNSTSARFRDSRQLWLTVTYSIINYKTKRQQQREFESEFDEM